MSSVEKVKDYFYPGKIEGLYQINLLCGYLLEYPLYGPDVDVLLVPILKIPKNSIPTIKFVGYQYVDSVSSANLPEFEDLNNIGEKGWSSQIKNYFERKLKM